MPSVLSGAAAALALSACAGDFEAGEDAGRSPAAARLIAPLSSTHATTLTPVLRWQQPRLARGARVELCADHACAHVLRRYDIAGSPLAVDQPLPRGVVFWRVTSLDVHGHPAPPSRTWELWTIGASPIPGAADTTWSSVWDADADGVADRVSEQGALGTAVVSAGDVDGDGFADLAVASGGVVDVFDGASARATHLEPGPVTSGFGATMAPAGDVNGDGYADLLVGGHELAQIFLGGPNGIAATAGLQLAGDPFDGATRVSGGGDVNGDRFPDVMVGGWSYLGTGGGFTRDDGGRFADGNFAGDVNGDGLTDYAGRAVHLGTSAGLSRHDFIAARGQYLFAGAGDTNGDGFADLLANCASATGLPPWRIYDGNPTGGAGGPQHALEVPGTQPTMPAWTAAGDLDGDGFEDVAVAVPADGAVHLFMGPGLATSPSRTLVGPGGALAAE